MLRAAKLAISALFLAGFVEWRVKGCRNGFSASGMMMVSDRVARLFDLIIRQQPL